jgi:hypothetical protein
MMCPKCHEREISVKIVFPNGVILICCSLCAKEMRELEEIESEERAN